MIRIHFHNEAEQNNWETCVRQRDTGSLELYQTLSEYRNFGSLLNRFSSGKLKKD